MGLTEDLETKWFGLNRNSVHSYLRRLERLYQTELNELEQEIDKLHRERERLLTELIIRNQISVDSLTDRLHKLAFHRIEPDDQERLRLYADGNANALCHTSALREPMHVPVSFEALEDTKDNTEGMPGKPKESLLETAAAVQSELIPIDIPVSGPTAPIENESIVSPDDSASANGDGEQDIAPSAEAQRIRDRYIIGKVAGQALYGNNGELIVARNTVITGQIVESAAQAGKLAELIIHMIIPGYGDE